jgi:hypothetical protein
MELATMTDTTCIIGITGKRESPGAVAWRSVIRTEVDGRQTVLMDESRTLRAALDLARKASATWPDCVVHVFRGKRIGRWSATFERGELSGN